MCDGEPKSEWHAFFDCSRTTEIWQECGLFQEIRSTMVAATDFHDCFFSLMQSLNEYNKNKFVMMLWSLWRGLNDKVWEGVLHTATKQLIEQWILFMNGVGCVSKQEQQRHRMFNSEVRSSDGSGLVQVPTNAM